MIGTAIAILFASASAPEPPEPRAARIENLPNGFTFAPGDPGTRDPVAAAILVRSPFNFPPSVGPNPSASNGLPPFTCAAGKGGVTLSPDSVDAPIRDELSPIAAGAEFWFTFTALDDFTTVQVETSNIQEFDSDGSEKKGTRTKARPILAIYKDRVASGEAGAGDFDAETGLDAGGKFRFILQAKDEKSGRGRNAAITGVTLPSGTFRIILFEQRSTVAFTADVTLTCIEPFTLP